MSLIKQLFQLGVLLMLLALAIYYLIPAGA